MCAEEKKKKEKSWGEQERKLGVRRKVATVRIELGK